MKPSAPPVPWEWPPGSSAVSPWPRGGLRASATDKNGGISMVFLRIYGSEPTKMMGKDVGTDDNHTITEHMEVQLVVQ